MDVWSRLWISTKVGDRNEDHVKAVISDTLQRGEIKHRFLFTTDGFKPYYSVIRELLPPCVRIVFASLNTKNYQGARSTVYNETDQLLSGA